MGYEMDKVKKIEIYDRTTGEKIDELDLPIISNVEEISLDEAKIKLTIPKDATFPGTIAEPPRPNISMIISPGDPNGNSKTFLCFYRPKYYNWFQRLMYKMCFGITIKQGDEVSREFL